MTNFQSISRNLILAAAAIAISSPHPAFADQEASNTVHVAAAPYGRCYAKSVPARVFDRDDEPRQLGQTNIYRVGEEDDVLIETYDWFAQSVFLHCPGASNPLIVRLGHWQRGQDPKSDHLAIAFYKNGQTVKSYSTLDIAGGELTETPSFSRFKNVSASVSHYTVFKTPPALVKIVKNEGTRFAEEWVVTATTIDGRELVFDLKTGDIRDK
ncbi:MAG: hypothetical protein EX271_08140 [Acidimicrobiales bacterium]|nr:hypothetical protein [Hyphomonadaceae bacterium]RZV41389.1 MAG: hypothetical protein EX271_08140 [Acidimicrobiales bacterium]